MGETISVLTYERSVPTSAEPTWSDVAVVDGAEGGACLPSATKVSIASTTRNYNLKRRVLEGPDFCAEEFRTVFSLGDQLNSIMGVLSEYSRTEWDIRDRHEYFRLCKRKVVAGATPAESNTSATTYPAFCASSILTQGLLDRLKLKLIRDGAAASAMGKDNGAPVLTLVTSAEASDRLIRDNADIRQDLRWGQPNELLRSIGVERSFRGFFHVIDAFPRRFTCAAGVYTEVAAFSTTAATKGNKTEVNPSYETATHEESFIFDPEVFHQLVPEPVVKPAADFRFDPISYMGSWKVQNIPDRVCNPDGNILYHRGILAAGSKPVHPERGVAIVHLRCDPAINAVASCT